MRVYYGDLPHWRQEGCIYAVTFRLADAMPPAMLRLWREARDTWLIAQGVMSSDAPSWRKAYARLGDDQCAEFDRRFADALDRHLDEGHGECLLRSAESARIVTDALQHFGGDRCDVGDLVVMANHDHVLVKPYAGVALEDILMSNKGYTARRLTKVHRRAGTVWQRESYDHIVRGLLDLDRIRRYIAANPAKAGVTIPEGALRTAQWDVAHA